MDQKESTAYPRVVVTLSSQDGDLSRSFVLNRDRPNIKIGRASKSGEARFRAQVDNGWIESPIMSRDHALIMMGGSSPIPLLIRDTGSTHGTFINNERLISNRDNVLKSSDQLSFGVSVTSGRQIFQPKTYKLILQYERSREPSSAEPRTTKQKLNGYHVPLPSDSDEELGDENFQEIPHREPSVELLSTGSGPNRVPSPDVVVIYHTQTAQRTDSTKKNHVDLTKSDPSEPQAQLQHQFNRLKTTANEQKDASDLIKVDRPQERYRAAELSGSSHKNTLDSTMGLKLPDYPADQSPQMPSPCNRPSTLAVADSVGEPSDTPRKQPTALNEDVDSSSEVEHDEDGANDDAESSIYSPSYSPPPPSNLQRRLPLTPEEEAGSDFTKNDSASDEESIYSPVQMSIKHAQKSQNNTQLAGPKDNSVASQDGRSERDSVYGSSEMESDIVSDEYDEEDSYSAASDLGSSIEDEVDDRRAEAKSLESERMHTTQLQALSTGMAPSLFATFDPVPAPISVANRAPSPSDAALVKTSFNAGPSPTSRREQYIPPANAHNGLSSFNHIAAHEPFWAQPPLYPAPPPTTTPWFPNYTEYGRDATEMSPMFEYTRNMQSSYDSLPSYYTSGPFSQVTGGAMEASADALRRDTASKLPTKSSKVHISDIVNNSSTPDQNKAPEPPRPHTSEPQHLFTEAEAFSPREISTVEGPKPTSMELKSGPPKRKAAEMEESNVAEDNNANQQAISPITAEKSLLSSAVESQPQSTAQSRNEMSDMNQGSLSSQLYRGSHQSDLITSPSNDMPVFANRGEPPRKKVKSGMSKPSWPKKRKTAIKTFVSGCIAGAITVVGAAAALIATTPLSVQEEALRSM